MPLQAHQVCTLARAALCRVPLPTWGLVAMLLPAAVLLLMVLVLPALQRQWRINLYTLGVILLGVFLYALLQLLRRTRAVAFCQNDTLARERWRPETLALALCALPGYLAALTLNGLTGLSAGVAAACGLAVGCILACFVVVGTTWVLAREDEPLSMDGDRTVLTSIPENGGDEAPLLRTFLHDSVVTAEDKVWRDNGATMSRLDRWSSR